MTNMERAASFLRLAGKGEVARAFAELVAPSFIHHNPYFKGDRQSLMSAMEEAHAKAPNRAIEIKATIEEGDRVVTHSLVIRQDPDADPIAVVHIFRFEGGKIAELWDVGQLLPKGSPNENGPF